MLKLFVTLVVAASAASSQFCPGGNSYTHIYRVGANTCPCNARNEGALRYRNKVLEVCDGKQYVHVGCEGLGNKCQPASSCKEIFKANPNAKNGLYYIKQANQVVQRYCVMNTICGAGGWSLIMKLDGSKRTFRYDSNYWRNRAVYNTGAVSGGLDKQEMKLDSYHLLSFNHLCVGMRVRNGAIRWLKIPKRARSLYSLIADGRYRATNLGRNAWKSLLKGSSLQLHCNREGFNAYHNGSRARIGIISNQENECHSPDSRIAFGGEGGNCGQNNNNSVGNEARCHSDNGDKSITAFGYILAQ